MYCIIGIAVLNQATVIVTAAGESTPSPNLSDTGSKSNDMSGSCVLSRSDSVKVCLSGVHIGAII